MISSILLFVLQLCEAYVIGVGMKTTSFAWSFVFISLFFTRDVRQTFDNDNYIFKLLALIGRYSFGIYLIHLYSLMIIGMLTGKMNIEMLWIAKWFMAVTLSLIIVLIIDRIIPSKYIKYIGIK